MVHHFIETRFSDDEAYGVASGDDFADEHFDVISCFRGRPGHAGRGRAR